MLLLFTFQCISYVTAIQVLKQSDAVDGIHVDQEDELPLWFPWAGNTKHGISLRRDDGSPFTYKEDECRKATPMLGTMKSANKLEAVMRATDHIRAKKVAGDVVEAGVAAGGGVLPVIFYLACTGDLDSRTVHLFDTWDGLLPTSSSGDLGFKKGSYHMSYDGFQRNIERYAQVYREKVLQNALLRIARPSSTSTWKEVMTHVNTVKGFFADTMPGTLKNRKLSLLMCDGDMYSSTKDCMSAAAQKVTSGGAVYNDDYYTFEGCHRAVNEYIRANKPNTKLLLVPQVGNFKLFNEKEAVCFPPKDNSPGFSGTCGKNEVAEGCIYYLD